MRTPIMFRLGLLGLLLLGAVHSVHADDARQRPNIVFIVTDDVSPDDLGIYGNSFVKTPHLDRLSRRGMVFERAYVAISSCSPSRCAMITGRYPHNTGAPELHTPLPVEQKTFVQALRAAGYHTVISGKNHMGKPGALGFDVSSDSGPAGAEKWTGHLRERPKDKPFFAWFASHDAHHPFQISSNAPQYDPSLVPVPPMLFDGPATRRDLANYYHEVSRADFYVGEVMRELEAQGITDNTFILFCGDNGRPFPRCKTYLYDSGIRTPLLVAGPGVKIARTSSLVSAVDFAATILELAGVAKPETVQGVSFVPVLRDPTAVTREVVFAERNWHVYQNHARAVRFGDWLYVWNAWPDRYNLSGESAWKTQFPAAGELWVAAEAGKLPPEIALLTQPQQPAEMLFNVREDPHQFRNLAGVAEDAAVLRQARALLDRWKEETGDSVPANPTRDRGGLHDATERSVKRGEFPGAARNATSNHQPGPIRLKP